MRLKVIHTTQYHYDKPVGYALQQLRLTPKSRRHHEVIKWDLRVEGGKKETSFDDHNNNHVDVVSVVPGSTEVTIHCEGEMETEDTHGVIGSHGGFAPLWHFRRQTAMSKPGARMRSLMKGLSGDVQPDNLDWLHALSSAILTSVEYEIGMTHAETTAEQALEHGYGVCQDHAHIFVGAARHLGFPARYVSGYLMMNDRVDQDATHAWAEAHVDGIGWVGFDISNGISPDARYVRVATGLDYSECAPVRGLRVGDSAERMVVSVQVQQ